MKVGLFFGSFNPIHNGHLAMAEIILESDLIDELWFVVSPQSPHKSRQSLAHAFDRVDMIQAAIHEQPQFRISTVELSLPTPNYTIHTLTVLKEKHPDKDFILILGQDNLAHFHRWKNYSSILAYFELLVYPRPHAPEPKIAMTPRVHLIKAPLLDISASFIRRRIKAGLSITYWTPTEVADYIESKQLYR